MHTGRHSSPVLSKHAACLSTSTALHTTFALGKQRCVRGRLHALPAVVLAHSIHGWLTTYAMIMHMMMISACHSLCCQEPGKHALQWAHLHALPAFVLAHEAQAGRLQLLHQRGIDLEAVSMPLVNVPVSLQAAVRQLIMP